MDNLIYLDEYILAKRVTNDFPKLIYKLRKFNKELYLHSDYIDILAVMNQINESIYMMDLSLEVYSQVLRKIKEKNNVEESRES